MHEEKNGRCSTDHIIQWRIIRNVILYKEHVRNLFSNTNDNKNSASTLFSYPGFSSSVFVYTGFRNSATILTLLCNSSCSGHKILAQILLDGPCFCFAKLKRIVGLVRKKNICIFGALMFAVYVEASIESYCFIPAHHRVRYSFLLFRAQCGKAFRLVLAVFFSEGSC